MKWLQSSQNKNTENNTQHFLFLNPLHFQTTHNLVKSNNSLSLSNLSVQPKQNADHLSNF